MRKRRKRERNSPSAHFCLQEMTYDSSSSLSLCSSSFSSSFLLVSPLSFSRLLCDSLPLVLFFFLLLFLFLVLFSLFPLLCHSLCLPPSSACSSLCISSFSFSLSLSVSLFLFSSLSLLFPFSSSHFLHLFLYLVYVSSAFSSLFRLFVGSFLLFFSSILFVRFLFVLLFVLPLCFFFLILFLLLSLPHAFLLFPLFYSLHLSSFSFHFLLPLHGFSLLLIDFLACQLPLSLLFLLLSVTLFFLVLFLRPLRSESNLFPSLQPFLHLFPFLLFVFCSFATFVSHAFLFLSLSLCSSSLSACRASSSCPLLRVHPLGVLTSCFSMSFSHDCILLPLLY